MNQATTQYMKPQAQPLSQRNRISGQQYSDIEPITKERVTLSKQGCGEYASERVLVLGVVTILNPQLLSQPKLDAWKRAVAKYQAQQLAEEQERKVRKMIQAKPENSFPFWIIAYTMLAALLMISAYMLITSLR